MSELAAVESRVAHLEGSIGGIQQALARIEGLIRTEVNDLKNEQIAQAFKAIERIADDQRRLWDNVGKLELRDGQRTGGSKAMDRVWSAVAMMIGAAITFAGSWLSVGKH